MNRKFLNTVNLDGGVIIKGGGGGGVTINNQEKSVDITENGTIEVVADSGFTGLSKVVININVASSGGDTPDTPDVPDTPDTPTYSNGVYVQHVDRKLYTEEEWTAAGFANDAANGVAVVTDNARFVIAKSDLGQMAWSSNTSTAVDGIMLASDSATALTDFAGYNNTQLMLATDTSGAGYSCANFTFPNGGKGYLPALGELNEAYANKSKIDSLMTKIGGAELQSNYYYWSSTQYSSNRSWSLAWYNGTEDRRKDATNYYVRAFSALPL